MNFAVGKVASDQRWSYANHNGFSIASALIETLQLAWKTRSLRSFFVQLICSHKELCEWPPFL